MNPSFLRNSVIILLDLAAAFCALNFTFWAVDNTFFSFLWAAPLKDLTLHFHGAYGILCLLSFFIFKTFQPSWRYTSLRDLISISSVSVYTNLGLLLYLFLIQHVSRIDYPLRITTIVMSIFIVQAFLSFPRVLYRYLTSERISKKDKQPALLFGTLTTNDLFLRYNKTKKEPYFIETVITTHEGEKNAAQKIQGIKVLSLERFLKKSPQKSYGKETAVIITDPKLTGTPLESIFDAARHHKLETLRVSDLHPSKGNTLTLRPVDIEDLLGRPKIELSHELPEKLLHDKVVMVTGAGGSIGSEIVHQVMRFGPRKVILVDQCEYFLYELDQSLRTRDNREHEWVPCMADVSDAQAMETLFKQHSPQVVFHAAAMKHVPLSEQNIKSVFENNVIGTWNMASLCAAHHTDAMILISTDKAVNPSNAMGLTKRIAEIICQAFDMQKNKTRYAAVRFGNVLGSRGSVIPLFQKQISQGGPITVTDEKMERYFMTISEAVSLVLQAGALGTLENAYKGGLFVLDMGKPVNILKMAEKLIELSGYTPHIDIPIVFTGMRSGEKLGEELFYRHEDCDENVIPGVHFINSKKEKTVLSFEAVQEFVSTTRTLFEKEKTLLSSGYKFVQTKKGDA